MLTRLIEWSLANRAVVVLGGIAVVVLGLLSFQQLDLDAFPDTMPAQVQVNTTAEAFVPTEVEQQITMPLEWALTGIPGVVEMRSISKFGLSQITLQFAEGTDVWFARQLVAERIATAEMPAGVGRPALGPVATGLGEVFHYLVRGEGKSLEEIREVHDWIIAPQLRSVPGVAEINPWGGAEKQWHVVVDPDRLRQFGLTFSDVYDGLEKNNENVGGGIVSRAGGSAALVVGVGRANEPSHLRDITLSVANGVPVRLEDVASVERGHEIRRGAVTADGKGEVVLGLGFTRIGENGHEVTSALARRLEEVRASLPPGYQVDVVHERTTLVDQVLSTVKTNLFAGALLVVSILFVFLGSLRSGLIVAAAIPFSMLFAFSGMLSFGIAGTLMSLGAIDFGLVVASSVILVENVERRLHLDPRDRSVTQVVRDAAVEVRKPSLFGELIIMVVYLPILALEGVEGGMFRPMALTVIFAVLGSVIFSMTILPVLASLFLRRSSRPEETGIVPMGRGMSALSRVYGRLLDHTLARPHLVLGTAVLLVIGSIGLATKLGTEFVPRLSEGSIVINTVRLADVSLEESVRYGSRIERILIERFPDEVDRIWSRTGTGEVATDPMGVELTDVFISLKPRKGWTRARTQAELVAEMEAELAGMPGMRMAFLQPIEMRTNEMVAGVRSDLGIKIFGDDLDLLKGKAAEIERVLLGIEGAADVSMDQVTGQPLVRIVVDRDALSRYGIHARDVLDVVAALGGRKAGELWEGERRFDVAVRLAEPWRSEPERLADVWVAAPDGSRVPLGMLTKVEEVTGPTTIEREWGKRRLIVQANVRGRDLGSFVAEVQKKVSTIDLPPGTFIRYGGQFEHMERAQARLLLVVPLALLSIAALLWFTYRRFWDCLRIFTGVPFAWVGGVLALWCRDLPLSISAVVGFITLSGIAVLDDMVLVSRIRQLEARGMSVADAVRKAALTRLRPVLMTTSVAVLGFLPMALSTGVGAEVQRPIATVVIGGVMSSTLLTLLVLPVLYRAVARTSASGSDTSEESGSGASSLSATGGIA